MTCDVTATVRGPKGQRGCYLTAAFAVEADSLAEARRRVLNTFILAGLEYGSLHIDYDIPTTRGAHDEYQRRISVPVLEGR